MTHRVLILPGDHIGPEIVAEAVKVFHCLGSEFGLSVELEYANLGGCAVDAEGSPLPASTRDLAAQADAILLGAVGGPEWDSLPREQRPERGLLGIRAELGLFANLRPAILFPELAAASSLRAEVVSGLDILIVRELTGGIYFGQPRGIRERPDGVREGFNTLVYGADEIERIGRAAFEAAERRGGCAVLGGQGQRAGVQRALARGHDRPAGRLSVGVAGSPVRGQRGHAAGPRAPAVRRHGDR